MNDPAFDTITSCARYLGIEKYIGKLPLYAYQNNLSPEAIEAVSKVFEHLKASKNEVVIDTLLRMSRLPQVNPKTFQNFDFDRIRGKDVDRLINLSSLSAVYSGRNLAFIGPPGVGKTHLAMAFGRECCMREMKTYFLKASELNQRFTEARKYGREGSTVNGLVKPTCLIIDEVGHCVFDKENTRLFFDVIDRRYSKDSPNCMIFTSNRGPDTWTEYFTNDQDLLCSLDRIFDDASVFVFKGEGYRGRKCETIKLEAGDMIRPSSPVLPETTNK